MPIFNSLSIDGQLQRKPGSLSLDEAQKKNGSLVAPTTPTTALLMGASPNAAQMAGGPAQLERRRSDMLEQADTAAQQATAKADEFGAVDIDQQMQQLSADISALGSLEGRVPGAQLKTLQEQVWGQAPAMTELFIDPNSALAQTDPQVREALLMNKKVFIDAAGNLQFGEMNSGTSVAPSGGNISDVARETVDFATGAITPMTARPSNTVATINAAVELAQQGVDEKAVMGSFNEAQGIGQEAAKVTPDKMSLAQANLSPEEQAALTRVGLDSSAGQQILKDKLREIMPQFNEVEKARQVLLDASATLQDQANARKLLRQSGVTGRYTPAQKINNIVAQLEEDDTVKFDGQNMTIDELLNNEYITDLAADAINDPSLLAAMKQDPSTKEFAEYLEQNRVAWKALLKPIEEQVGKVQEFRDAQMKAASFADGSPIPEELMDALNPSWRDMRTAGLGKAAPILGALKTLRDPASIKGVTSLLMEAQAMYPSKFKELASMDLKTLSELGLLDGTKKLSDLVTADGKRTELAQKVQGQTNDNATINLLGESTAKEIKEVSAVIANVLSLHGKQSLGDSMMDLSTTTRRALERIKQLTEGKIDLRSGTLDGRYLNQLTNTDRKAFWQGTDTKELTAGNVQELMDELMILADTAKAEAGSSPQQELETLTNREQEKSNIAAADKLAAEPMPLSVDVSELFKRNGIRGFTEKEFVDAVAYREAREPGLVSKLSQGQAKTAADLASMVKQGKLPATLARDILYKHNGRYLYMDISPDRIASLPESDYKKVTDAIMRNDKDTLMFYRPFILAPIKYDWQNITPTYGNTQYNQGTISKLNAMLKQGELRNVRNLSTDARADIKSSSVGELKQNFPSSTKSVWDN